MLEKHWTELGADARPAHQTMGIMTYFAADSVLFLQGKLAAYQKPPAKAEAELMAKLLADLDSDQFDRRQRATDQLEELGEPARPALEKALASQPSLEVRQRVVGILKVLDQRQTQPSAETMRMLRGVELLERVGSADARKILMELASGPAEVPVCRQAQETLERLKRRGGGAE